MIWLEPSHHLLRVIDGNPADQPDYRAVGNVWLHGDVAILTGFHGQLSRADLREIVTALSRQGAGYILVARAGNHRLPLGQPLHRPGEPFHGWWFIPLQRTPEHV